MTRIHALRGNALLDALRRGAGDAECRNVRSHGDRANELISNMEHLNLRGVQSRIGGQPLGGLLCPLAPALRGEG